MTPLTFLLVFIMMVPCAWLNDFFVALCHWLVKFCRWLVKFCRWLVKFFCWIVKYCRWLMWSASHRC